MNKVNKVPERVRKGSREINKTKKERKNKPHSLKPRFIRKSNSFRLTFVQIKLQDLPAAHRISIIYDNPFKSTNHNGL